MIPSPGPGKIDKTIVTLYLHLVAESTTVIGNTVIGKTDCKSQKSNKVAMLATELTTVYM